MPKDSFEKNKLHPKNKHHGRYDLDILSQVNPLLKPFVFQNKYGNTTINFSNPKSVKYINQALLKYHYHLDYWDIPEGYLTPSVPSRAEYIHRVADLFENPKDKKCLDIGVGANAIYPIVGIVEYQWNFVGSDIDESALQSAREIVNRNSGLKGKMELRKQNLSQHIFQGIIRQDDFFDLVICNPPFFSSFEEFQKQNRRKNVNLKNNNTQNSNFKGQSNELWCRGGELSFISQMILESVKFKNSVYWFTTLVSQEKNLKTLIKVLRKNKPTEIKIIPFHIGNKQSRVLAWRY